jgi:HlyD family secretion protein
MTASVDINTKTKKNTLAVPLASVTTRNPEDEKKEEENKGGPNSDAPKVTNQNQPQKKVEDKTVLFVNDKGVAKMVEVKTGISDYDNIEILSGIQDSSEVITGPFTAVSKRLKEGDKVKQMQKKEPEKKSEN